MLFLVAMVLWFVLRHSVFLRVLLWQAVRCVCRRATGYGRFKKPAVAYGRNRRKPDWVVEKVIRLKALCPGYGCSKVAQTFNRLYAHQGMTVSRSYVAYTIRDHRYRIAVMRRELKHRRPRQAGMNHEWALDLTGKMDDQGKVHHILGIIDHGSRRCLCLRPVVNKCAWSLLGQVCLAIGRYGKPKFLRTDNETVFRSSTFRAVLMLLGIRQRFSVLGCPWTNGRMERFFGTLKERLNLWAVENEEQLRLSLDQFEFFYNAVRPHAHLDGATPLEAWNGVEPYRKTKGVRWFEAWDGLLTGFHIRR